MRLDYHLDGSGVEMATTQSQEFRILQTHNTLMEAIYEIVTKRKTPALYAMVNRMKPGIIVPVHTDTLRATKKQGIKPRIERWHLPIITNSDAIYWSEECGEIHLEIGSWHGPIRYWEPHTVINRGKEDRIHLIVDLDTPFPVP